MNESKKEFESQHQTFLEASSPRIITMPLDSPMVVSWDMTNIGSEPLRIDSSFTNIVTMNFLYDSKNSYKFLSELLNGMFYGSVLSLDRAYV